MKQSHEKECINPDCKVTFITTNPRKEACSTKCSKRYYYKLNSERMLKYSLQYQKDCKKAITVKRKLKVYGTATPNNPPQLASVLTTSV